MEKSSNRVFFWWLCAICQQKEKFNASFSCEGESRGLRTVKVLLLFIKRVERSNKSEEYLLLQYVGVTCPISMVDIMIAFFSIVE